MFRFTLRLGLALALSTGLAAAQDAPDPPQSAKHASVVRVPDGAIRVDGRMDEEVWLKAPPITDFTQKEPVEGAAPTDQMEVRFAYDGTALLVGARMFTRNDPHLQAPLGRRDDGDQAEHIQIWLDTFLDRRTAWMFGVTAAGVRLDRFHPTDNEQNFDAGFDPVWEAHTTVDADGWTAELWIPLSQLRFSRRTEQLWGLNVRRFRPNLDEEDYWVIVPRTERVFISRFGDLSGLSVSGSARRIELMPYVAGASTVNDNRDPGNPFDDGKNLTNRFGADTKIGLGSNLTLEATVNPDFGQVEADPAEVNLTAFETRFPEKRPFFLEGARLFTVNHPNFYYSRRIGGRPTGPASGEFVDYPSAGTILGAAKLTGRLPSRTLIGVMSGVSDEETAQVLAGSTLQVNRVPVAPRSYFGVGRVQQEFGRLSNVVGMIVTANHRNMQEDEPLANLLSKNAVALAGDALLRFKGGEYEYGIVAGGSFVEGSAKSIERIQRTSAHYAQRPDRDYDVLDPTRTSLTGFSMQTRFERVGGTHWLWDVGTKYDTPMFETNDVALLMAGDAMQPSASIKWRETRPGRIFRNYTIGFGSGWEWNFGGNRQNGNVRPSVNVTWSNFWTSSVSLTRTFRTVNQSLTRGGPLMTKPNVWSMTINAGNRTTSPTRLSTSIALGGDEFGGSTQRVSGTFSFRPGPRWQFSVTPFFDRVSDTQQYVTTVANGRPATYGNRYIFSVIDRSTVSSEYRLNFTLRPDMNLDVYAEPFAASGRYYDFGELLQPSGSDRLLYGTSGTSVELGSDGSRTVTAGGSPFTLRNYDFNTLSFRSNVVLRWEWRPGSTLYLVWQQDRSRQQPIGTYVSVSDMFNSATVPGTNFFVVKTSFWLSMK